MKIPTKIQKLLEPCKYVEKEVKAKFMPIVQLACDQHEKIKRLEDEIRSLKQVDVFTPRYGDGETAAGFGEEAVRQESWTREEIIYKTIKNGEHESEAFQRSLRWWKITMTRAFEIFSEIEEKNKQNT